MRHVSADDLPFESVEYGGRTGVAQRPAGRNASDVDPLDDLRAIRIGNRDGHRDRADRVLLEQNAGLNARRRRAVVQVQRLNGGAARHQGAVFHVIQDKSVAVGLVSQQHVAEIRAVARILHPDVADIVAAVVVDVEILAAVRVVRGFQDDREPAFRQREHASKGSAESALILELKEAADCVAVRIVGLDALVGVAVVDDAAPARDESAVRERRHPRKGYAENGGVGEVCLGLIADETAIRVHQLDVREFLSRVGIRNDGFPAHREAAVGHHGDRHRSRIDDIAVARRKNFASDRIAQRVVALHVDFVAVLYLGEDDLPVGQDREAWPQHTGRADRVRLACGYAGGVERPRIKLVVLIFLQRHKAAAGQRCDLANPSRSRRQGERDRPSKSRAGRTEKLDMPRARRR